MAAKGYIVFILWQLMSVLLSTVATDDRWDFLFLVHFECETFYHGNQLPCCYLSWQLMAMFLFTMATDANKEC